jgi:ParB-like chromosome segregation protein Spo0J
MKEGVEFPPITVFRGEDGVLTIGDGFHRVAAARLAGLTQIKAEIQSGSARDALMFNIEANARHGLRFSNRDKRRAVNLMLDDPAMSAQSDRAIAKLCGVSHPFVSDLRNRRQSGNGYHLDPLTEVEKRLFAETEARIAESLPGAVEFARAVMLLYEERYIDIDHLAKEFGCQPEEFIRRNKALAEMDDDTVSRLTRLSA